MAKLPKDIENFTGTTNGPDTIRWIHNTNGVFSRLYKRDNISNNRAVVVGRLGLWRIVWDSIAPTKVKCFAWLVAKRACLTLKALHRKDLTIVPICFLSMEVRETNNHFCLHYRFQHKTGQSP